MSSVKLYSKFEMATLNCGLTILREILSQRFIQSLPRILLHLRLHFLEEIVQVDSIPVRCQWWLTRTVTLAGTSFPGRLVFVLDDQTLPSGLYIRYSAQGSRLDKIVPHSVSKKSKFRVVHFVKQSKRGIGRFPFD